MHRLRPNSIVATGVIAVLALGGVARAAAPISLAPVVDAGRQTLDPAVRLSLLALRYSPAEPEPQAGVARTSIDHRAGGLTASAGFLCGRHAGPDNNGAATERGYDPEGRFVGAKLSFAFR